MNDIHENIKELEISLHQADVRNNKKELERLLHPSFREVGYSGTTYDFKSILNCLLAESTSENTSIIWSQDYEFIDLSTGIILVMYLTAQEKNGVLTRHARRTSIWVKESLGWKMQYHQATPIASFSLCKK